MPWTFAHPAAVLPLRRLADAGFLSFPALLVGCITPDVVYHVGRWDLGRLTHTPLGVLLVDVPTGLVILWCGAWLQRPVAGLLPEPHRSVLTGVSFVARDWRGIGVIALSLVTGAGTHLLWDAFTHADAYFVRVFEVLGWPVRALGHEIRVFKLLQYGGTLVGVLALGMTYRRHVEVLEQEERPRTAQTHNPPAVAAERLDRVVAIAVVAVVLALPIAINAAIGASGDLNLYKLLVRQVAYTTSVFVVLVIVVALARARVRR